MAVKTFYATRDMKHPLYRGRMLTAGEPLELDGPTARLYTQLKAITTAKPKRGPQEGDTVTVRQTDGTELTGKVASDATATLKPKRKAAARKKAPAKK